MKEEVKAVIKGAALGAALIALSSVLFGCESMPNVTVPHVTVRGNYADYSYSAKGGIVIAPRYSRIVISDK